MNNDISRLYMKENNNIERNVEFIINRFPNVAYYENGKMEINFETLKQELSSYIVDETKERYQLTWPGKKQAMLDANSSTSKSLRPIKEKSVDFENTKNIYIEGDNLSVLKVLQESYLNKIKCIYIDPPYNTGKNLIYKNDFSRDEREELLSSGQIDEDGNALVYNPDSNSRFHSDWMSMIYSRIKLARNLLTDDGIIIIAMDQSEITNLTKICDEIFGESNQIGIVTVVHKPEGRNQEKFFGTSNEFSLFYAKNKEKASFQNVVLDPSIAAKYDKNDAKGNYRLQNFIRMTDGKLAYREVRPKFWYPIYVNVEKNMLSTNRKDIPEPIVEVYPRTKADVEMSWKSLPNSAQELIKNGELEINIDNDGFITIMEKIRETQVIKTHWVRKEYNAIQYGSKIITELFGAKLFDFPKSLYLICDTLKLCMGKDDIVLDFFSGSATTAHAIMKLNAEDNGNRKYIMVQIPESCDEKSEAYMSGYNNICEIGEERIRRAGTKIKEETNADIDYGFRVYRLDSSNMKDVYYEPSKLNQTQLNMFESNIKEDRTAEDLLTQVILNLGLTLDLRIEEKRIGNNKVYFVAGNSLVACFDNQINIDILNQICEIRPLKVVFRESSFRNDSDKINAFERIKKLSPETEISVI